MLASKGWWETELLLKKQTGEIYVSQSERNYLFKGQLMHF